MQNILAVLAVLHFPHPVLAVVTFVMRSAKLIKVRQIRASAEVNRPAVSSVSAIRDDVAVVSSE